MIWGERLTFTGEETLVADIERLELELSAARTAANNAWAKYTAKKAIWEADKLKVEGCINLCNDAGKRNPLLYARLAAKQLCHNNKCPDEFGASYNTLKERRDEAYKRKNDAYGKWEDAVRKRKELEAVLAESRTSYDTEKQRETEQATEVADTKKTQAEASTAVTAGKTQKAKNYFIYAAIGVAILVALVLLTKMMRK
jgi:hypothetical protein